MANYDASIRVHTDIDTKRLKEAEIEVQQLAKKLDMVRQRSAKLETLGGTERQLESLGYDAMILEERLADATERAEQLAAEGFDKAEQSAKKCFKTVDNGAKKSNKSLGSTMKTLKNMVLSMVAFQVMAKGAEYIVSGFKNLVQYSSELNVAFSELKSQTTTLKYSLAAAFEPVVTMILPALSKFVSWLNTAANSMAHFLAVLRGKDTYTKAKNQVIDYAKSLKSATKAAKGAVAAFDDLNILNKRNNQDNGTSGELSTEDVFEEVAVDETKFSWLDYLKDNLNEILTIVGKIGAGFLGWKIVSALPRFLKVLGGWAMIAAGAVSFLTGAIDAWNNGIDWGNLSAIIIGLTLLLGGLALAFGPVVTACTAGFLSVSLFWLGMEDILKNGLNLKNALFLIASAFLVVSSMAVASYGAVGIAIGALGAIITGLILAVAADWEDFKVTVWEPMKQWFVVIENNFNDLINNMTGVLEGFIKFFEGVLTGDFDAALEGAKDIFKSAVVAMEDIGKGFMNVIIGLINTIINVIEGAINAVFDVINRLDFTVPDWVPAIGGKKFGGFNLQPVNWDGIPYLATGGTVTSATLANLGEGGRKEVVLPLEQNTEWADILADKINTRGGETRVIVELDGKVVYNNVVKHDREFAKRTGSSSFAY